jgi:hypothetical protein
MWSGVSAKTAPTARESSEMALARETLIQSLATPSAAKAALILRHLRTA